MKAFIRPRAARLLLALLVLLSAARAPLAQQQAGAACTVRVTLLQVNDVYQFTPSERGTLGGLARLSTLRKQIMKESPHTLFLLAGDTISPSVESITYKGRQMIDAWNQIGLDYSVFGNHEFDFGAAVLRERMAESKFKWLGANVIDAKTGKTFGDTPLFEVRELGGVKVGLVGLVLPETKTTSSPGPDVEFRDVCETARKIIPQVRAAGAQTIVALTHLSLREDKQLARCAPGFDVIVGGHEHTLLESSAAGVPIFKMTADAKQMGRIDLNIDPSTGKVESMDWQVINVTDATPDDPEFSAVTTKYGDKIRELSVVVGRTLVALDARSATSRTEETNIADFIADAFRRETGADVALINGGSIRADTIISAGDLSLRDVLSILPFSNDLVKIEVTGETLRKAIEHGVSRTAPGAEPGRFPQVAGMRYSFDATLPAGSRVRELTVGDRAVDPKRKYTLVTTRYVAEGGDQYEMLKGHPDTLRSKLIDSDVLRRAIAAAPDGISPRTDRRIRRLDTDAPAAPCKAQPSPAAKAAPAGC
ncbi:MAG TPA: bifunctional UDP-sugar hydrolase/5'-nucleotidase [Pyrinomonadaceae bacterium]|nr:bifunctional UDP-sugar hydrolase/5'-nucleotidase [Pyrinomonadaceae bacterium]